VNPSRIGVAIGGTFTDLIEARRYLGLSAIGTGFRRA